MPSSTSASAEPRAETIRNTTNLVRFVGVIAAWGFLSLGGAMALWSLDAHRGHVFVFVPLGIVGIVVAVAARRIAVRLHGGLD